MKARKHHYIEGKEHIGKRRSIQGRNVYLFDSFGIIPKRAPPGGLLQGALCPFQGSFLRSSSSASQFTFRAYGFD